MLSDLNQDVKLCYYCQRNFSTLYEFTNCIHKICTNCLFQRIFINNIQDFTGTNIINVKCKCGKGDLDQTLGDVSSIIMKKTELDEKNKDRDTQEEIKICPNHKKNVFYLNHYCIECFTHICKECQSQEKNEHHTHRILPCGKLKKIIKNNIEKNLFLNFDSENFKVLCDDISKKIQNEVEINFNQTLNSIDSNIKSLCEFREEYVKKYKEEIKSIIQTFKIIKIYYMNYYNDKSIVKENEKGKGNLCNNINFLRYVNNISYEFGGFKIEHNNEIDKFSLEITNLLKKIKQSQNEKKLLTYDFYFTELKRDYMIENIIPNVHGSYITGLIELNNERLLTSCRKELLMKIFQDDDEGNGYIEKVQKNGACGCLLYFEDKNRIFSGDINGIISIYEELSPKTKPNEYSKTQTLQNHDGAINSLSRISENQIISGGVDGKVVIWEEQDKVFLPIDSIKMDRPIIVVLGLFDSRITFCCDDKKIFIYKVNEAFVNIQKGICKYIEDEILIKHKGRVSCLCQLNNSYIVSGGTEKVDGDKKIFDHYIIVWRTKNNKYICSQILKNHEHGINSIIQLRDGNFASSSIDRTVKIWKPKIENEDNINTRYESYELIYDLRQYDHGIHKLIQLKDDRLCATTSKNQIVFWRNRSGSY